MTWITHEVVAVGTAFLAGFSPAALAGALIGSILPDMLDQRRADLSLNRQRTFARIHRGTTHWFGWWAILFFITLLAPDLADLAGEALHPSGIAGQVDLGLFKRFFPDASGAPAQVMHFIMGMGFGGLMHVLLDMCTVYGIPALPWTRKIMVSLHFCRTGSPREYLFLAAVVVAFAYAAKDDLRRLLSAIG